MNDFDVGKIANDIIDEALQEPFETECPNCHLKFKVSLGSNHCPNCGTLVTVSKG
ncbi:hypothetical protein HMPREF0501_00489 [Limosilactobacillus coleohominis 101-4-CHN]|uniref:Uncharacterized protein n=1 Tax=Limosilactobacillus coleohominis 101-4-CHN TaxID=575594 RepID=C7XUX3_9LACO|nr:hypothetical protein [Limosilactobacillus coleohominis]EEU31084.1 hypothetical protein HMPREF0501_00489 [Limosilactobacillus coleohominis 101-4-CHN]